MIYITRYMEDLNRVYEELLSDFYTLYPAKRDSIKLNSGELEQIAQSFCKQIALHSSFKKLLCERDARLFKVIKTSLLPKIKMEIVLYKTEGTDTTSANIIDRMWKNVWLIYLITEAESIEPDGETMKKIASLLETKLETKLESNLETNFETKFETKSNNNIMELVKNVMGNATYTNNSKKFTDDILDDIKQKINLSTHEGKIDGKKFVEQLLGSDETVNKYKQKMQNGEISFNEMLGVVQNMMSNDSETSSSISKALQLDKLDPIEVLEELKKQTGNKLPPEIAEMLNGLDAEKLKNLDIGSVVSSAMMNISSQEDVKEITDVEREEMMKFYEELGKKNK